MRRIWSRAILPALLAVGLAAAGCSETANPLGHTWYIDGVGNWGFGVTEVPAGLAAAGYKGRVDNFHWSITMNPLLDQTFRVFAKAGGARLAGSLRDQLEKYPDSEVNVIGLSAGTGVAIWAVEELPPNFKVRNVVLLSSSLSSRYDLRKALSRMTGQVIVYFSPRDSVLDGPCRVTGTIDGQFDSAAGLIGMKGPGSTGGRVVNIGWNSAYARLGWMGNHTDSTSLRFIEREVSKYIVTPRTSGKAGPRVTRSSADDALIDWTGPTPRLALRAP